MKIYNKVVIDLSSGKVVEEDSFEYSGLVAEAKGGNAGKVQIDQDIATAFKYMLNDTGSDTLPLSLYDVMTTALNTGGNPFDGETAFDPNGHFEPLAESTAGAASPLWRMAEYTNDLHDDLESYDTETVWKSFIDAAYSKLSSFATIDFLNSLSSTIDSIISDVNTVLNGSQVDAAVTAYENQKTPRFMRSIGRFAAGMAMSNAVMSSAYVMGIAWREFEFEQEVDNYERGIKHKIFSEVIGREISSFLTAHVNRVQAQDNLVISGSQVMSQIDNAKHEVQASLSQLKAEIERLTIVAEKEYKEGQLKIDESAARWDFDVFTYGGNLLSQAQGSAAYVPPTPSRAQSALSGGISMGLTGAKVGFSVGGPIGAGVGGILGALVGAGAALL